jgi:hypothetical protein
MDNDAACMNVSGPNETNDSGMHLCRHAASPIADRPPGDSEGLITGRSSLGKCGLREHAVLHATPCWVIGN